MYQWSRGITVKRLGVSSMRKAIIKFPLYNLQQNEKLYYMSTIDVPDTADPEKTEKYFSKEWDKMAKDAESHPDYTTTGVQTFSIPKSQYRKIVANNSKGDEAKKRVRAAKTVLEVMKGDNFLSTESKNLQVQAQLKRYKEKILQTFDPLYHGQPNMKNLLPERKYSSLDPNTLAQTFAYDEEGEGEGEVSSDETIEHSLLQEGSNYIVEDPDLQADFMHHYVNFPFLRQSFVRLNQPEEYSESDESTSTSSETDSETTETEIESKSESEIETETATIPTITHPLLTLSNDNEYNQLRQFSEYLLHTFTAEKNIMNYNLLINDIDYMNNHTIQEEEINDFYKQLLKTLQRLQEIPPETKLIFYYHFLNKTTIQWQHFNIKRIIICFKQLYFHHLRLTFPEINYQLKPFIGYTLTKDDLTLLELKPFLLLLHNFPLVLDKQFYKLLSSYKNIRRIYYQFVIQDYIKKLNEERMKEDYILPIKVESERLILSLSEKGEYSLFKDKENQKIFRSYPQLKEIYRKEGYLSYMKQLEEIKKNQQ